MLAGVLGRVGAIEAVVIWLGICYAAAYLTAFSALALNFSTHWNPVAALDMQKAFRIIRRAPGAYLKSWLIPLLFTMPASLGLVYVDLAIHQSAWVRLLGFSFTQIAVLWNLMALKQWVALLQPNPLQTQDPGLNPC